MKTSPILAVAGAVLLAACGATADEPLVASSIAIQAGNAQSGVAGRALSDSVVVEVLDQHSNPVAGAALTWKVVAGEGTVAGITTTGADGRGAAKWRLGRGTGSQKVSVSTAGVDSLVFTATSQPPEAMALSNTAPSTWKFVHLNTETAAATLTVSRPEITFTAQGEMTVDPTTSRYFVLANNLFTLDAKTGSILSTVTATQGISGIQYDSAGAKLVALTYRTNVEELVRVDPQTGGITSLSFIPEISTISQGSASFDPTSRRYFFVASDNGGVERLYSLNAANGSIVAKPSVTGLGISGTRFDPESGGVVGLTYRTGVEELIRINPSTGAVTSLGLIPEVKFIETGEAVLDGPSGRYIFIGSDLSTDRLFTVDVRNAAVLAHPIRGTLANLQVVP